MVQSCYVHKTDAELAACLRAGVQAQEEQERLQNQAKLDDLAKQANQQVRLLVRDTASSITNFAGKGLGEKGASVSVQRVNGVDASQAQVALFGVLQEQWGGAVQPFVGAAWSRDGAAVPKRDVRQWTVGTAGPLWQTSAAGHETFSLIHTLQLSRRYDVHGSTDGMVGRLHFDLAWAPLANGELLSGVAVLPHVAALLHRRTGAAAESGHWRSVYVGAQLEKPFEIGQQRLKATASARRLFDLSVPRGNDERQVNRFSLSLDYYFYDPENKTAPLQPSLFITRETGTDFLEYGQPTSKTTAGIRVKFH